MKKQVKHILLFTLLTVCVFQGFADRGLRRKAKNRVVLNIATENSFRNSISVNLKTGMKYKGLIFTGSPIDNPFLYSGTIRQFQKGNTIYLVPSKQRMLIPEVKQGYTGLKLVLKSTN
jgi:hypothetical protein